MFNNQSSIFNYSPLALTISYYYQMKNTFKLATVLLVLCQCTPAICQTKPNENLNQLIRLAIENAPKIKEQQQNVLMGDFKTKIQETAAKPQVQGDVGISRTDPMAKATLPFGPSPVTLQFQPNMAYNVGISANYVLYDWGRQAINLEKIKLEMELSKTNLEALKNLYAYQVATLYYGIVYLLRGIDVQKDQLKLISENGLVITDRIKSGDALEYDQVSVEVRYKNTESRLEDLKGQLERQYIYLGALVGKDIRNAVPADADFGVSLANVGVDEAMAQAQNTNLDLKAIKDRDAMAERDVLVSQKASLPTLAAVASVGLRNGYLPRINGEVPAITDDFRFGTNIGVRLTIPIYTGHRGAYQTEVAKISRTMLKYSAEAINQNLKRDLEAAKNDLNTAQNKLVLSEKTVAQAQYALKLAETRFKNGVVTNVEIDAAQTALREAQFNQLQYKYQMTLATLEINRLIGTRFW